jgi:hypothetical protein
MAQLYDQETKQVEIVPDEQVAELVSSGRFLLPKGRVSLVNPKGEEVTVEREEAAKAFSLGYSFLGATQRKEREDEAKYGDRPIAASALGFGRGVSFGATDYLLGVPAAQLAARRRLREASRVLSALARRLSQGAH